MRARNTLRLLLLLAALGLWLAPGGSAGAEPLSQEAAAENVPEDSPDPIQEGAFDEDDDWLFGPDIGPDPAERDPMESFNRGVFRLNEGVYK